MAISATGDKISIPGYTITPYSNEVPGNFRVFDFDTTAAKLAANLTIKRSGLGNVNTVTFLFSGGDYSDFSATATWPGATANSVNGDPSPANFLAIYENGEDRTHAWSVREIDTATFQAITAATSIEDATTAMQGFDFISLYAGTPDLNPGAYSEPTNVRTELTLADDVYNLYTSYVKSTHMEMTTWAKALYMELSVSGYKPLFQEFEVWRDPLYMEFSIEPYTPLHMEFQSWKAPLNMEFTPTPSGGVTGATGGLTVSDDCGTATLALTVPAVVDALDVGEQFEWTAYRYGVQIATETNTDTSWSFSATSDGAYNVQVVRTAGDGTRTLENNTDHFIDCRTLKCISRIAKEDVESDMCGECKFNEDWKVIYALWYTARMSFAIGNIDDTRKAFKALQEYCQECNEKRCGCN